MQISTNFESAHCKFAIGSDFTRRMCSLKIQQKVIEVSADLGSMAQEQARTRQLDQMQALGMFGLPIKLP